MIGVTLGDAAGIGPELVAKALASGVFERAKTVIIGDESILRRGMHDAGVNPDIAIANTIEEAVACNKTVLLQAGNICADDVEVGTISAETGKDAGEILTLCLKFCSEGFIGGFCFSPLNKGSLKLGGFNFASEHEMFADYFGITESFGEMNVMDNLWNMRITGHVPLSEVAQRITVERILEIARLGNDSLKRAGIEKPRFAVAALNPHAGDSGTCGNEEIDIIEPAVKLGNKEGILLYGPFASDTLFIRAFSTNDFDGIISMYHDQGQTAIKLKGFDRCVTVAAGLPYPIATPAHGTAFDIAGTGKCSISSFTQAFNICANMIDNDCKQK